MLMGLEDGVGCLKSEHRDGGIFDSLTLTSFLLRFPSDRNKVSGGNWLSMASIFKAFWNSPVGPKTTHFWGPVSNCGFVAAAMMDTQRSPELISGKMTSVMCIYSALFMRFAWMINPRNYFLLGTHMTNESVQLYQLSRWASFNGYLEKTAQAAPE